jgi:hypothetical protein
MGCIWLIDAFCSRFCLSNLSSSFFCNLADYLEWCILSAQMARLCSALMRSSTLDHFISASLVITNVSALSLWASDIALSVILLVALHLQ